MCGTYPTFPPTQREAECCLITKFEIKFKNIYERVYPYHSTDFGE